MYKKPNIYSYKLYLLTIKTNNLYTLTIIIVLSLLSLVVDNKEDFDILRDRVRKHHFSWKYKIRENKQERTCPRKLWSLPPLLIQVVTVLLY